jgi:radical SAM protein with 4Fe4S-binding SPASM domain
MISEVIRDTKYNPEGELIVILFEQCNLTCQFCPQDHNSKVGIDSVEEKSQVIAKALDVLKSKGKRTCSINFMGGELFDDSLPDEIFLKYENLIAKVKLYSEKINLPINMHIASNMVWNKTQRVIDFIKRVNIPIAASYDPAGRFNQHTLEIFKENVMLFKEYIGQIGVVMTKPNIAKFMKGDIPFFKELYDNFEIVFDHYTHTPKADINFLMPTDVSLRDFFMHMIDNWPKCQPFVETADSNLQPMFCMQTAYVFPDSSVGSCGTFETGLKPLIDKTGNTTRITISPLEKKIEGKWFSDYNCIECEHLQRCSFGCFLNNHIKDSRTQEACWLKEVYDYVDNKNSIR